jgi:two-component system, NtrC family, nitrogen regulation response regulator GlnG
MRLARRVLIVEDDSATLDLFCTKLRQAGYEVEGAASVADALTALSQHRYAVVLADHVMPDIHGLELLAVLRRTVPGMPVIFYSGFLTAEVGARAREFGAFAVLEKPVSMWTLVRTVRAALS